MSAEVGEHEERGPDRLVLKESAGPTEEAAADAEAAKTASEHGASCKI